MALRGVRLVKFCEKRSTSIQSLLKILVIYRIFSPVVNKMESVEPSKRHLKCWHTELELVRRFRDEFAHATKTKPCTNVLHALNRISRNYSKKRVDSKKKV